MKSGKEEDLNAMPESTMISSQINSFLFLFNKQKQNPSFRIENNCIITNKAKKEKVYSFKEIFSTEDSLFDCFSKIVDLNKYKITSSHLILLYGARKTKKKAMFIEILEELIINFLDIIRNKGFGLNENNDDEENPNNMNYELKVNYEQYPPDANSKDLVFSLNSHFYVSQMISHHQKLTSNIENSFNKFKSSFMKRSYLSKNENTKKIRYFKMTIIKCSETSFQQQSFYIFTSNKKSALQKNNNKMEFLEEVLNIQNYKLNDFDLFKDTQKHFFYFIDGSKNINEFPILNTQNSMNFEEAQPSQQLIPLDLKKSVNLSNKKKDEERDKTQNELLLVKAERDDLKKEILDLNRKNQLVQEELERIILLYNNVKLQETEKPRAAPEKETNQITPKVKKNFNSVNSKPKEKTSKEKNFFTPKTSNAQKIVFPIREELPKSDFKLPKKNLKKENYLEKDESEEDFIMEENPRQFPGKVVLKKLGSLN